MSSMPGIMSKMLPIPVKLNTISLPQVAQQPIQPIPGLATPQILNPSPVLLNGNPGAMAALNQGLGNPTTPQGNNQM